MASGGDSPLWARPELRDAAGETLRPGGFELTDRAAEFIGIAPGWTVLDVGGGLGATVDRLRSRFGARAWGVEPSAEQIARAPRGCGMIRAGADRLPFRSGTFDVLFCECVFSLIQDREAALREFRRVLRPGGFLVLSDLYATGAGEAEEQGDGKGDCPGCASGAISMGVVRDLTRDHGFMLRLLEDHSRYLRDLAARLVLAGVEPRCGRGLGYLLMIAEKRGIEHAG